MTARSTSEGMSRMVRYAGRPPMTSVRSLTAQTVPVKRWASRLYNTSCPRDPGVEPAPITATLVGVKRRRTEAAAAVASRRSRAASASGVGWRSKDTSMTPSANVRLTSKPAVENTVSILELSGSTDAVNVARPCSCRCHEVFQKDAGQAPLGVRVVDEERHLGGRAVAPALVPSDAHQFVAEERHEGHAVHVVDVGQVHQVLWVKRGRAEK